MKSIDEIQSHAVEGSFEVNPEIGEVSTILLKPAAARVMYLIAHGAGAGMRHAFLETMTAELYQQNIATLRYQFPYMEAGKRFPDRQPILIETVQAAIRSASKVVPDLILIAGGKSMGGRMTTLAASQSELPGVNGLVLIGFPLHAAGKPGKERADHLQAIELPMLFLQGTRDTLADFELMKQVKSSLGEGADFYFVEGADHMFKMLKKSGRSQEEALEELTITIADWAEGLVHGKKAG